MPKDFRNLPDAVRARLGDFLTDRDARYRDNFDVEQQGKVLEARAARAPELRRNEDGTATLDGYATVYEYAYDVAGGPPYGWTETIARGAATKSVLERDRVGLLVNHDSDTALGLPLAATYSRALLTLNSDDTGLAISATLGPSNLVAAFLIDSVEQGNADSMSFAFQALRQEWNEDYTERRILEVKLFDVSVVCYPANPAAIVQVRDEAPPADAGMPLSLALAQADRLRLARVS